MSRSLDSHTPSQAGPLDAREPCFLVGDVGATNLRLALTTFEGGQVRVLHAARASHAGIAHFEHALAHFLEHCPGSAPPLAHCCLGVAGPITAGRVRLTNRDWTLDADSLRTFLGGVDVDLVNDLAVAATGIDALSSPDIEPLQGGTVQVGGTRLVIGAGTGLGVASLAEGASGKVVIASEGGHVGFAPRNDEQWRLLAWLRRSLPRVEAEHIVSGPGFRRVYDFVCSEASAAAAGHPCGDAGLEAAAPAVVCRHALEHPASLARQALDLFVDCFGAVAGDQALVALPRGGVFLVGTIAAAMLPRLRAGGFTRAFNDKGAMSALLADIPVSVVTDDRLALVGATLIARSRQRQGAPRNGGIETACRRADTIDAGLRPRPRRDAQTDARIR